MKSGREGLAPTAGQAALSLFWIAALSGIPVAVHYDTAHPLFSIERMHALVPFGGFFHSLHLWSGYLFLVAALVHLVKMLFVQGAHSQGSRRSWLLGILAVPPAFFLMLSGFLLRGSRGASDGLAVLQGILAYFPWVAASVSTLPALAVHHTVTLTLLVGMLVYLHTRRARVPLDVHAAALSLALASCLAFPGLPPDISGAPWYGSALQETLRYVPTPLLLAAGAALLGTAVLLVALGKECAVRRLLAGLLIAYGAISVLAWTHGGITW